MSTNALEKARLRAQIDGLLNQLTEAGRAAESTAMCRRLVEQKEWQQASAVLFFAPFRLEPNLWPLLDVALAEGKRIALPAYDSSRAEYVARQIYSSTDVRLGRYGIREPFEGNPDLPLKPLDLALIPGVAFDPQRCRLGRGQGYYDRLLASFSGVCCGVAFECQMVPSIPREPHDVAMNCILTPTRWIAG